MGAGWVGVGMLPVFAVAPFYLLRVEHGHNMPVTV